VFVLAGGLALAGSSKTGNRHTRRALAAGIEPELIRDTAATGHVLANCISEIELCEQLGITPRTLWEWRRLGKAPPGCFELARKGWYHRDDVTQWLRSRADESTPPGPPRRKAARRR